MHTMYYIYISIMTALIMHISILVFFSRFNWSRLIFISFVYAIDIKYFIFVSLFRVSWCFSIFFAQNLQFIVAVSFGQRASINCIKSMIIKCIVVISCYVSDVSHTDKYNACTFTSNAQCMRSVVHNPFTVSKLQPNECKMKYVNHTTIEQYHGPFFRLLAFSFGSFASLSQW